jgi:methylated-DNA-[protein]-cysteine S-methyltransferase
MIRSAYALLDSPIGELALVADGDRLSGLYMSPHPPLAEGARLDPAASVLRSAREQLVAYFAGERTWFALDLALAGTAFQLRIWEELQRIPFGETISYGELARRIGRPRAVRAAGLANGRNPVSLVVPCHRVIGADGSLTGYGGGLPRKRWLLDHERAVRERGAAAPPPLSEARGDAAARR